MPLIFVDDLIQFSVLDKEQARGIFFSRQGRLPSSTFCVCPFQGSHRFQHCLLLPCSGQGDALAPRKGPWGCWAAQAAAADRVISVGLSTG